MNDHPFTGIFMPAELWQHQGLTWTEKCLAGEILALGGARGECLASDEYLARQMGMPIGQIGVMIEHLKAHGMIKELPNNPRRFWTRF